MIRLIFMALAVLLLAGPAFGADRATVYNDYIYLRTTRDVVIHDGVRWVNEMPTTYKNKSVLTLKEAALFIRSKAVPFTIPTLGKAREVTKQVSCPVNGYDLTQYNIQARSDYIGASSPASNIFSVLEGDHIYELHNEEGFQEKAALKWYHAPSKVPAAIKRKVIAQALLGDANILGFVEAVSDIEQILKSHSPYLDKHDDKVWSASVRDALQTLYGYYRYNPLPTSQDGSYYIGARVFPDFMCIKVTRKCITVQYQCLTPCPGLWAEDPAKGQYNGVRY